MALWGSRKQQGTIPAWYACAGGGGMVPKGYVPMVLVDEDGEEEDEQQGQRILVNVRMLREPCMAALLEMAAQQFGHGQRGVLRIPCNMARFQKMINGSSTLRASCKTQDESPRPKKSSLNESIQKEVKMKEEGDARPKMKLLQRCDVQEEESGDYRVKGSEPNSEYGLAKCPFKTEEKSHAAV